MEIVFQPGRKWAELQGFAPDLRMREFCKHNPLYFFDFFMLKNEVDKRLFLQIEELKLTLYRTYFGIERADAIPHYVLFL